MDASTPPPSVAPRITTLTLKQLKNYNFADGPLDDEYPGMSDGITAAIKSLQDRVLEHDLKISMPRLEALKLAEADFTRPLEHVADDEESRTLAELCRSYLALLNRFNNYVGQGIEELIGSELNGSLRGTWTTDGNLSLVRNAVQFPDLYLIRRKERRILLSVEVKSWFVFAKDDITARFEAAPNIIRGGSLIVLVPWCMTNLVSGSPRLLLPYVGDAKALAERRDDVWKAGGGRQFAKGQVSPKRKVETPVVDRVPSASVRDARGSAGVAS
jgi:hypothetical protein